MSEPVDIATGRTFHTNTDFELNGPIPVLWSRTYYSDVVIDGPLGYSWHHSYNIGIRYLKEEHSFLFRHADGRESVLPELIKGQSHFDRFEKLLWSYDDSGYVLCDSSGLLYRFNEKENLGVSHGFANKHQRRLSYRISLLL